jgi:hypothetical protein
MAMLRLPALRGEGENLLEIGGSLRVVLMPFARICLPHFLCSCGVACGRWLILRRFALGLQFHSFTTAFFR